MKNIFNITLLGVSLIFLFTGCSHKGQYQHEMVNYNLQKNLSKVEDKTINIISSEAEMNKSIEKNAIGILKGKTLFINMEVGNINNNVLKEFSRQYFKEVTLNSKEKSFIEINSNVIDWTWEMGTMDDEITLNAIVKAIVKLNEKEVINKTYKLKDYKNQMVVNFFKFKVSDLPIETFHKGLLHLYETQVKKDLLDVITKN